MPLLDITTQQNNTMTSSKILAALWRKAASTFQSITQKTEVQERLPNERELREHQEAIQDIIDIFIDTQDNASSSPSSSTGKKVHQVIASDTSSGQAPFFRKTTSNAPKQVSASYCASLKRSADEANLPREANGPFKKPVVNPPFIKPTGAYRKMSSQDDKLIWERYQARLKEVLASRRGSIKKKSHGFASQIAEELRTNRQTITARLRKLRKIHENDEEHEWEESDAHSLQSEVSIKHESLPESSNSRKGSDDYWTASYPGFCYNQQQDTSQPLKVSESNHSSSSTSAPSAASAVGSVSKRTEAPLAPPPHIPRKSTFSHNDDVILWNAYIRNGCQLLSESQYTCLASRLKRSNTSCIHYRIRRLMSEDQGVSINSLQTCAFTPTDDARILHAYNTNAILPAPMQESEDALCCELSRKVRQESVRVLYRLHYLLNQHESASDLYDGVHSGGEDQRDGNNEGKDSDDNDSVSSTASKEGSDYKNTAHCSAPRDTSYYTRYNKGRFYSEEEDMVIWTAYLCSTNDVERNSALLEAAKEINRSFKSVRHRLQRLLEGQHKAEAECITDCGDDVGGARVHAAQHTSTKASSSKDTTMSLGTNAVHPVQQLELSDESSYAERDCSSDEGSICSDASDCDSDNDSVSDIDDESSVSKEHNANDTVCSDSSVVFCPSNCASAGHSNSKDHRFAGYANTEDSPCEPNSNAGSDCGSDRSDGRSAEDTTAFLTRLRSTGMNFISPRSSHYQVLAALYSCLHHLHASGDAPLHFTAVQHYIAVHPIMTPELRRITTTQLRGVLVLLQRAGCVKIHDRPHVNLPIMVQLLDLDTTFQDLRRRHDRYLETLMAEQGDGRMDTLLWPRDPREQMYLKMKVERVMTTVCLL